MDELRKGVWKKTKENFEIKNYNNNLQGKDKVKSEAKIELNSESESISKIEATIDDIKEQK